MDKKKRKNYDIKHKKFNTLYSRTDSIPSIGIRTMGAIQNNFFYNKLITLLRPRLPRNIFSVSIIVNTTVNFLGKQVHHCPYDIQCGDSDVK